MGSTNESVRVNICGDEYSIKTDVDIETTKKIAEYVNQKMMELKKTGPIRDTVKVAVLSALNIAGELHEYRVKCGEVQKKLSDLQHKATKLTQKIEGCFTE
jgi:cell division protein ZapA